MHGFFVALGFGLVTAAILAFSAVALSAVRPLRSALIAVFRLCAVTPAWVRIRPASLSFSTRSASSIRSTVT